VQKGLVFPALIEKFRKIPLKIRTSTLLPRKKLREDNYSLGSRNCEHFANMIVYGINYSEQAEDKKDLLITKNIGSFFLGGLSSLA
jgi:hypothetical protein